MSSARRSYSDMPFGLLNNLVTITAINMRIRLQLVSDLGDTFITQEVEEILHAFSELISFAEIIDNQAKSFECKICNCRFSDINLGEFDHHGLMIDETESEQVYEFECDECRCRSRSEQIDEAAATGN